MTLFSKHGGKRSFHTKGKFYQIENFALWMKPLQKPMPPTWVAASSDETLIKTGELGFGMMGIPFARSNNILEVKEKNDLFKESYLRAGHKEDPDIIVALHVCLQQSEEGAVKLARPHFARVAEYLKTSRRPGSEGC